MTDVKETLAMLEAHPLTRKFREEEAAEALKLRESAADRLEELRREAATVLPTIQTELTALKEELMRHDEGRKIIQSKLSGAALALATEKQRLDLETREAETVLLETCNPRIDEAITFFKDKHETLLTTSIDTQRRTGKFNAFRMSREVITFSNIDSIRRALSYCLGAVSILEKMKLIPVVDTELIEALKTGMPSINEMKEITTDKPLPAGPESVNPLHLLPSDSELHWRIDKIGEKFRELMRR